MESRSSSDFVQKFPTDKAYFIAKELLTTERTYLKDLKVITEVKVSVFLLCSPPLTPPSHQRSVLINAFRP